jgi:hypothetical protein
MKRNTQQLKDLTIQVRDILRMVHNVNSGHPVDHLVVLNLW